MMRTLSIGFALVLFATSAFATDHEITIKVENTPAVKLSIPTEAGVDSIGNKTRIQIKALRLTIWPVSNAKTIEEAVPIVPEVVKSEIKDFVVASNDAVTVAGAPAKHLKGKGAEADDNDPSTGEVVVFTVGDRIFAACVHWEGEGSADERQTFLDILKSAKAP